MENINRQTLRILGIRGVPAEHGGFETFAEKLAIYLVSNGWSVIVYNQVLGAKKVSRDYWNGIQRIHIPIRLEGALGTLEFDWKSVVHASRYNDLVLTLGYNTAIFELLLRLKGVKNIKNMDGLEWKREKWNLLEKIWLYTNEKIGCLVSNHLIADHPKIKEHLKKSVAENKITMIPYGATLIDGADPHLLNKFGVKPKEYALVVARPEPENSLLEIVSGFSRKARDTKLVVLGNYKPDENNYHRKVISSASNDVKFPGAVYDKDLVNALRYHCLLYIHGHKVGGTNPSLVEALGAGSPILAHENEFNKWVAGVEARYFKDEQDLSDCLDAILDNNISLSKMARASRCRFEESFEWIQILRAYEELLSKWNGNSRLISD